MKIVQNGCIFGTIQENSVGINKNGCIFGTIEEKKSSKKKLNSAKYAPKNCRFYGKVENSAKYAPFLMVYKSIYISMGNIFIFFYYIFFANVSMWLRSLNLGVYLALNKMEIDKK